MQFCNILSDYLERKIFLYCSIGFSNRLLRDETIVCFVVIHDHLFQDVNTGRLVFKVGLHLSQEQSRKLRDRAVCQFCYFQVVIIDKHLGGIDAHAFEYISDKRPFVGDVAGAAPAGYRHEVGHHIGILVDDLPDRGPCSSTTSRCST